MACMMSIHLLLGPHLSVQSAVLVLPSLGVTKMASLRISRLRNETVEGLSVGLQFSTFVRNTCITCCDCMCCGQVGVTKFTQPAAQRREGPVSTHGLHIIAFVWHRTILTRLSTWAQMVWVIADKSISPALRSLQLSAEKGTSIPMGCRRMHPDFSHLHHLSITRDIYLCINFICQLLPLRCVLPAPVGQGSRSPPVLRSRPNLAGEICDALCMRLLSVRLIWSSYADGCQILLFRCRRPHPCPKAGHASPFLW